MGDSKPRFGADTQAFFYAGEIDHSYSVVFYFEDASVWNKAAYATYLAKEDIYMYKKRSRDNPVCY